MIAYLLSAALRSSQVSAPANAPLRREVTLSLCRHIEERYVGSNEDGPIYDVVEVPFLALTRREPGRHYYARPCPGSRRVCVSELVWAA